MPQHPQLLVERDHAAGAGRLELGVEPPGWQKQGEQ